MQNQHQPRGKIWLATIALVAMLVSFVAGGRRAGAQPVSVDDSPAAAENSSSEDNLTSAAEPASNETTAMPPVAESEPTAAATDDSAAVTDSNTVDGPAPELAPASNGESASGSQDSSVLEIPQVIDLANGNASDQQADGTASDTQANADDTAQSGQNGQEAGQADNLAEAAGQLGTLQDYENHANEPPPGPILFGPGMAVVRFPRPPLFNPPRRPLLGVPLAPPPIILPPTSTGPFPSTSPMLMPPRIGVMGAFHRGGLMGFRR